MCHEKVTDRNALIRVGVSVLGSDWERVFACHALLILKCEDDESFSGFSSLGR